VDAGLLIKEARERSGLSRRHLARLAGTSASTLGAYEAGRSVPSVKTLERILRSGGFALDVELRRDDVDEERRLSETLTAVLEVVDAFPRNPAGPLRFPSLATVVTP